MIKKSHKNYGLRRTKKNPITTVQSEEDEKKSHKNYGLRRMIKNVMLKNKNRRSEKDDDI